MNLPNIDIRTVVLLMVVSNLFTAAVLSTYEWGRSKGAPLRRYIAAKLVLAAGFLLLGLRDFVPELLSLQVGNPLVFVGFYLESAAFGTLFGARPGFEKLNRWTALGGTVLFWLAAHTPGERVAIASLTLMLMSALTAWSIPRGVGDSPLKGAVVHYCTLMAVALGLRAWIGALAPDPTSEAMSNLVQALLFVPTFVFILVGCVLFLVRVHEQSERTLLDAHEALQAKEAMLQCLFETSPVGIFVVDHKGVIQRANPCLGELLGRPVEELVGAAYRDFLHPDDRGVAARNLRAMVDGNAPTVTVQRQYQRSDGKHFWGHLSVSPMSDPTGRSDSAIGVISDISELKRVEEQVRALAQHDPLTGLANRTLFADRLDQALIHAQRDGTLFALAYVDLDRFKAVNDAHGHAIGDALLVQAAARMLACVRDADTVARLGGDEFVLLLRGVDSELSAMRVADKVRQALVQVFVVEGQPCELACSVGVAVYPTHGLVADALLQCADAAMYRAKAMSGNHVALGWSKAEAPGTRANFAH